MLRLPIENYESWEIPYARDSESAIGDTASGVSTTIEYKPRGNREPLFIASAAIFIQPRSSRLFCVLNWGVSL
jgi:hypothetical protein